MIGIIHPGHGGQSQMGPFSMMERWWEDVQPREFHQHHKIPAFTAQ